MLKVPNKECIIGDILKDICLEDDCLYFCQSSGECAYSKEKRSQKQREELNEAAKK